MMMQVYTNLIWKFYIHLGDIDRYTSGVLIYLLGKTEWQGTSHSDQRKENFRQIEQLLHRP